METYQKRGEQDPREVVEVYAPHRPAEIVEVYAPQQPTEIVEVYAPRTAGAGPRDGGPEWDFPPQPQPAAPPRRRSKRGLWIFLVCMAVLAALVAGAAWLSWERQPPPDAGGGWEESEDQFGEGEITVEPYPHGEGAALTLAADHGAALTAQEVYAAVNPAVVTVITQLDDVGAAVGTGVVFTRDGYIMTNYHVLSGGAAASVTLASGEPYDARYVGGDEDNDIAILKIDAQDLPAAVIGDSDALTVGDTVYAIGNPLGVELRGTLTDGIVSAINRNVRVQGRTMTLIQTNAALNQGNSGGPLINVYGQVVGINTVKMMSLYGQPSVEGLGFALPMASLAGMVNDILTYGEVHPEPTIGISFLSTQPVALPDGLQGLEISEVSPDSAADAAGLLPGDVVVSAGGRDVRSFNDLLKIRRDFNVGDSMDMTVWRDGAYLDFLLDFSQDHP